MAQAHIVKSELTPATWQKNADLTALVVAVVLLAILGVLAAVSASSTVSAIIAALVGLTSVLVIPASYAMSHLDEE